MALLDTLLGRIGFSRRRPGRRASGYAAADHSRLTASLASETEFINRTLRYQLRQLRARARQAAANNPYGRAFAGAVVRNVCGPTPFRLQSKIKTAMGAYDDAANTAIEREWQAWGKKGGADLAEMWSWAAMQRLIVRQLAIDGEVLVRKYRGPEHGRHGYRLQVLDVDRLNDYKNAALPGGGAIHMGVELDANGRRVAYHLLRRKPAQWESGASLESDRVPAEEIIHLFVPEHAEQVRGVPWMYAALLNLVHLGAFEEAAVIAARVGASQMGVITSPDGVAPAIGDGQTDRGEPVVSAEPGAFPVLPEGYRLESWNPKYPDAAIEPFIRSCLRGVAAGLDMAYHNLTGDMTQVNYSSARIAELNERDAWMSLQTFLVEHLHEPVYADWLLMQSLTGTLTLRGPLEKYLQVVFTPRRWAWVDPEKEVNAQVTAIEKRLKSRTQVVAEQGGDFEELLDEIAQEEMLADAKGVELDARPAPAASSAASGETDGGDPPSPDDATAKALADLERELAELRARDPVVVHVTTPPVNVEPAQVQVNVDARRAERTQTRMTRNPDTGALEIERTDLLQ